MVQREDISIFNTAKKLLIVSHNYNDFVKDSSEPLSPYFEKINVCVRYNPLTEILSYLSIDQYKNRTKKRHIDLFNKPSNINITPTKVFYGPFSSHYKKIGEKHYQSVVNAIYTNEIEFDLIHSQFTWSAGYVGAKLKERYGVPFIVTAHGYDIYDLPFRDNEWKQKIEYVLNSADHIITVSHRNLEYIKKLDVKTPVKVIPNGFNPDLFHLRDAIDCRKCLNLPFDKKIILTVGNLVEVKGHEYLINSIDNIIKYRKDILCIIVGSGKLKNVLEKKIKKSNLENYIGLVGGKDHNEVPIWMNACDVFVLPSLNEGNPTVMFECLGCGKPFVGTKVGGIPEIINNEELGYIIELANSDALADAIIKALEKRWDEEYIINYAKQYSWEKITKKIVEIYDEVFEKE